MQRLSNFTPAKQESSLVKDFASMNLNNTSQKVLDQSMISCKSFKREYHRQPSVLEVIQHLIYCPKCLLPVPSEDDLCCDQLPFSVQIFRHNPSRIDGYLERDDTCIGCLASAQVQKSYHNISICHKDLGCYLQSKPASIDEIVYYLMTCDFLIKVKCVNCGLIYSRSDSEQHEECTMRQDEMLDI